MRFEYSLFGLRVEADLVIPGLIPESTTADIDLRIETGYREGWPERESDETELHASTDTGLNGRPLLRIWALPANQALRFVYDDEAEFVLDMDGSRVRARWPEELTIDDIGPYLLGPILGFVLRLRGTTCLHASAVSVEDRAVVLVGPPGAGKSTTAAAFARLGFPVISDDKVALTLDEEGFLVQPGYPWLRLWRSSVEALFGTEDALPRIAPDDPHWNKQFLDVSRPPYRFRSTPAAPSAVYILAQRSVDEAAPRLLDRPSPEKLLLLVGNTYMNYVLDSSVRQREFEMLGRLLRNVPVRVIAPHASADRVFDMCSLILGDFADGARPFASEE